MNGPNEIRFTERLPNGHRAWPNPAVTLNRLRVGKSMSYGKECYSSRLRNPLILRGHSGFYRKSVTAGLCRSMKLFMPAPVLVVVVQLPVRLEILALRVKSGSSRDSLLWLRPQAAL